MKIFTFLLLNLAFHLSLQSQMKSIVYDFDGLDIGATDLPDGDFRNNDLTYFAAPNPLAQSDVIGDRVLRLDLNWSAGIGEFGKSTNRYIQLNASADYLNFYFYNPPANSSHAVISVNISEDDNQDDVFQGNADDVWTYTLTANPSGQWQLFSLPLSSFVDNNIGGNGIFDAAYSNPGGKIFSVSFIFSKPVPASTFDQYYMDMICFSEGTVPHGNSILDLPLADPLASSLLGALGGSTSPDQVPAEIHSYLPANKKLTFINWFMFYSKTGNVADQLPGQEVQNLLNAGYTPVITWEMMYYNYSRLDPMQPRLDKILDGTFDTYIDAFAGKIKSYNGTVIMRIFHEFEGDWYCWSLTENNKDASKYIAAYRHVVDRFRNIGANNVQWMWCVNAEPKPYTAYNWIISCYPGDNYVDIVANDIYNHPDYGIPPWRSFRYTMAESYYYLTKFIPQKPFYICEVGCRERDVSEPGSSQNKGDWLCQMNKDLQTYFNRTKALIFFSIVKEHDWRINSSSAAQQSFVNCIWDDNFYKGAVDVQELDPFENAAVYPNPFADRINFAFANPQNLDNVEVKLYDINGKLLLQETFATLPEQLDLSKTFSRGMYVLQLKNSSYFKSYKLIKEKDYE